MLMQRCYRVLLDDQDMYGRSGGGGYEKYGIDKLRGAIVIVRPDGYVGTISALDNARELNEYFASFLKA